MGSHQSVSHHEIKGELKHKWKKSGNYRPQIITLCCSLRNSPFLHGDSFNFCTNPFCVDKVLSSRRTVYIYKFRLLKGHLTTICA